MEMLELAAELKWCRERITALEAERDQLRARADEIMASLARQADELHDERDQLAAELAECKRLIRKLGQYVPNDDPNRDIMRALTGEGENNDV